MRELRQEISRGRVSHVVEGGAIAYIIKAKGLFKSWWEVAIAGTAGIHEVVRNVWRQ